MITVEALKEGWDCSFAYVFCSVQRIQSATDAEQLLGRVLRMPYAKRRAAEPLNRAYAHVSEASFGAAASGLADKLVAMGFEEDEAKDAIEPAQGHLDETGLFAQREKPKPVFRHMVSATPDALSALQAAAAKGGVSVTETGDGKIEIAVTGRVAPDIETAITTAIPALQRQSFAEAVRKYRVDIKDQLSPAEQGEAFVVPRLVTEIQGTFEFADTDVFMEFHDWQLANHPARLDEGAFAIRDTARSFEIDVDGNRVTYQFADEAEQLALDVYVEGWTPQNLVLWLDRQLRQPDVHQSDLLKWLTDCIGHLVGPRKLSIPALMRTKFILARKLNERIGAARAAERSKLYQRYLFAPEATVDISFDNGFSFRDGMYADQKRHRYTGRFRLAKHFLGADAVPAFDGTEAGEEFQCAQALDSLPQVKFWIRNVARHPQSFWLPTASDKFYPDFVALLNDERFFVVEYKGALLAGAGVDDTNEKRAIGRLWESRSAGRAVFLVVEREIDGHDMRTQMLDRVGRA